MVEYIVVVEARADAEIAQKLAERVLVEQIDWLDAALLQYQFQWRGLEENERCSYSCWRDVSTIIKGFNQSRNYRPPRFLRRNTSEPLRADGAIAMKVLNLIRFLQHRCNRDIQAVLFIRDLDNQPQRRCGLDQARTEHQGRSPRLEILIGTANRMREAWVLNGFIALTDREWELLQQKRDSLKFDPCRDAHRLRSASTGNQDRLRCPKVVLECLTEGNYDREKQCWEDTSLEHLREIGTHTGLTDYLNEIQDNLVPLVAH